MLSRRFRVSSELCLCWILALGVAHAQESPQQTDTVVSDAMLANVRTALESAPGVVWTDSVTLFYAATVATPNREAYVIVPERSWASPGGVDVLGLVMKTIDRVKRAHHGRQVRQIREQIQDELHALEAANGAVGRKP